MFAALDRGKRAYDVVTLRWTNIQNGRLQYRAQKSPFGKKGKEFDIKITPAMECLKLCVNNREYVFPCVNDLPGQQDSKDPNVIQNRYRKVGSALSRVNKILKEVAKECDIEKNLSMHIARHTFAFLADDGGLPLGIIQNLRGHGDIMVTRAYVESIRKSDELDKATEVVF